MRVGRRVYIGVPSGPILLGFPALSTILTSRVQVLVAYIELAVMLAPSALYLIIQKVLTLDS